MKAWPWWKRRLGESIPLSGTVLARFASIDAATRANKVGKIVKRVHIDDCHWELDGNDNDVKEVPPVEEAASADDHKTIGYANMAATGVGTIRGDAPPVFGFF